MFCRINFKFTQSCFHPLCSRDYYILSLAMIETIEVWTININWDLSTWNGRCAMSTTVEVNFDRQCHQTVINHFNYYFLLWTDKTQQKVNDIRRIFLRILFLFSTSVERMPHFSYCRQHLFEQVNSHLNIFKVVYLGLLFFHINRRWYTQKNDESNGNGIISD